MFFFCQRPYVHNHIHRIIKKIYSDREYNIKECCDQREKEIKKTKIEDRYCTSKKVGHGAYRDFGLERELDDSGWEKVYNGDSWSRNFLAWNVDSTKQLKIPTNSRTVEFLQGTHFALDIQQKPECIDMPSSTVDLYCFYVASSFSLRSLHSFIHGCCAHLIHSFIHSFYFT